MVAFTLLMLRLAPLQGWKAVIVAGVAAGMVFDTIQFRVGPPRLWDSLVFTPCWRLCWRQRYWKPPSTCTRGYAPGVLKAEG